MFRKLNLLTSKHRPFCHFCGALCGFHWFTEKEGCSPNTVTDLTLCEQCFKNDKFPPEYKKDDFELKNIDFNLLDEICEEVGETNGANLEEKDLIEGLANSNDRLKSMFNYLPQENQPDKSIKKTNNPRKNVPS